PSETIAALVDRSGGNAFYLEELIRAVAQRNETALPQAVLSMVQARLMRLNPDARRILRAASVFGDVFWRDGILSLVGGAEQMSRVDAWRDDLARSEIIVHHAASRLRDEEAYAFRHQLLREAAYAMLTDDDRKLGHRLAGRWLVRAGEDDGAVLAEHF